MRVRLIAVGTKAPSWVNQGYQEYSKRFPREFNLELIEIPLAHRGKNADTKRLIQKEGETILSHIQSSDWVVALEVKGKRWTTEDLAKQINNWQLDGKQLVLLVGGPDGLSDDCRKRANQLWSLSDLTLPHPLVRILLAESLYRAWTVTTGHPYHRG